MYAAALLVALLTSARAEEAPRFTFAVLADVQYADQETRGARAYRDSLGKLDAAVAAINAERPAFTI